ncbi:ABC transporter ATP-binding protein [Candidatus Spongiihabitans sp.]|uniref:ABC transporter ATP-binding protein n=1 Tax=Candidatus Spongiihabitans sp. TaxID=3101308 RepID=UPI003C7DD90D
MLKIERLNAYYGAVQVLRDFSLSLSAGEVLCLFGRNGAGKTTALKSIMGLVRRSGSIEVDGEDLIALPAHLIPRRGIGYVPQGRRLFAELTVAENMAIGLMARGSMIKDKTKTRGAQTREQVLALFPPLASRLNQVAGTLSGGEQQMLAMARALCLEPSVLLLDEPSEGLMPSMLATIREVVMALRQQGVAILLVEQRVEAVLPVADRVAFIENGRIADVVGVEQLSENHDLFHKKYIGKYVGVSQ